MKLAFSVHFWCFIFLAASITIRYRHKIVVDRVTAAVEETESVVLKRRSCRCFKGVFTGVKSGSCGPKYQTTTKMANRIPACVIDVGTG